MPITQHGRPSRGLAQNGPLGPQLKPTTPLDRQSHVLRILLGLSQGILIVHSVAFWGLYGECPKQTYMRNPIFSRMFNVMFGVVDLVESKTALEGSKTTPFS